MFWKFVVSTLVLPISLGLEVAAAHTLSPTQTPIISQQETEAIELEQTTHNQDYKISQRHRHYRYKRTRNYRQNRHYRRNSHYRRRHYRQPYYRQRYNRRYYYRPHYQRVYYYHPRVHYRRTYRHGVNFPQNTFYYPRY
ncbi:MAG: hypothetical protein NHB32_28610 [Fischerella sp. CENA71]|nr:hypothetical protein [Fischerella sp. CENA71]